ncbi:MAG TPA: CoA ester lyase [Solirubrobacterales bacterium]|nr:CoA ester lyase [Solirubrobacterales bacterium]
MRARRACLSVPAAPAPMPEKGRSIAVDEVVLDLEDSVPVAAKDEARETLVEVLGRDGWAPRSVAVRINGLDSPWWETDVGELVSRAGGRIDSIVVPKVEDPDQLRRLDARLTEHEGKGRERPIALEALIETAAGLRAIDPIAAATPRLEALILGPADLAASLGLPDSDPEERDEALGFARSTLLVAARAARVAAIDGPFLRIDDEDGLRRSAARARALGYDGKWALHPRQIEPLERVFTPGPDEIERARAVLAALAGDGRGAVALGGEMVDEASRKRAEAILARAEAGSGPAA